MKWPVGKILAIGLCFVLSGCANNVGNKTQTFQLAQVHNQAAKPPNNLLVASHYVVVPYKKGQQRWEDSQKSLLNDTVERITDHYLYRADIIAAPINSHQAIAKNVIETEHVEKLMKEFKKELAHYQIVSTLIFDKKIPSGQVYIEIKPKINVSHSTAAMQPLGQPVLKTAEKIKKKIAEHGLKL